MSVIRITKQYFFIIAKKELFTPPEKFWEMDFCFVFETIQNSLNNKFLIL